VGLRYTHEASTLLQESLARLDSLLVHVHPSDDDAEELRRRIAETAPVLQEVSAALVEAHDQLDKAHRQMALAEEVVLTILLQYVSYDDVDRIMEEFREAINEEPAV
jgi:uncharacterized coiled-coil protein SlyX